MSYFSDAGRLLIEVLFGLACGLFLLRVLLQWATASFHNPITQFFYRATNPLLVPLRRLIPPIGRVDSGGVLIAWLIQVIKLALLFALSGLALAPPALLLLGLAELIELLLTVYLWLLIIYAILSFVGSDRRHPALPLLVQLTEPVLRPIRRLLPMVGSIDFSPMIAVLAILLARVLVVRPIQDLGMRMALGVG
jgi:YggT family protein